MCYRIVNLAQNHRKSIHLPNGGRVSPTELDERFSTVSPEKRAEIARLVLAAIPKPEREKLHEWVGTMTKARPVPSGHTELVVFLAVAAATHAGNTVNATANLICTKQSAAGILLAA